MDSNKIQYIKRWCLFLTGLFTISMGIAVTTKAMLGTTPIAAFPYTLSLAVKSISYGTFVIIFNYSLIVAEIILMRRNVKWADIIPQFVITIFFGYFVDLGMKLLVFITPTAYFEKILWLLLGCLAVAFGVFLELKGKVTMLPYDGFVRTLSEMRKSDYGRDRVIFDSCMVIFTGILNLILFHRFIGVREGTVIIALITGSLIHLIEKIYDKLTRR